VSGSNAWGTSHSNVPPSAVELITVSVSPVISRYTNHTGKSDSEAGQVMLTRSPAAIVKGEPGSTSPETSAIDF
jgi:hypothetical protein